MRLLRSHLSKVRIPEPGERISTQECCVSFSTARSEGGLFVDMCTFVAFGKEYVTWNYEKIGNPIYLNIQETPKQVSDNWSHKKPKSLAIGVEGGSSSKEPEYEETYSIVVLPDFISLPYPSAELPEKVRLAVDGVLAAVGEERKEVAAAWTADKKQTETTTAERELDQNTNFDWNRLQEKGRELEPLIGPGLTGLSNLGNSCYLASVMQAVFSTKEFQRFYYDNMKLEDAFKQAPADPTRDLHMQLSKLAYGILSGKYSVSSTMRQDGIPPRMFKSLIGTSDPKFASSEQQDALQFFQHLMNQVEKSFAADAKGDPSQCFNFRVEERTMCTVTEKVKYTWKTVNALSLHIPLRATVNNDEVAAYKKRVAEKELAGQKSDEEIVCPRVPLSACLENYSAPEEVPDFYSSAINARTTAIKTTRIAAFPDYLVLHIVALKDGQSPKKLDVSLDVPDEIDISGMRSSGPKPDEQLLPETRDEIPEQAGRIPDQEIFSQFQLADMGLPRVLREKALQTFSSSDVEEVMNWVVDNSEVDEPSIPTGSSRASSAAPVNETALEPLVSFGSPSQMTSKALAATGGDTERAAECIQNDPEESKATERDVGTSNRDNQQVVNVADGSERYQLLAFVSHLGTSTQGGHNVAHVRKDDRWVLFNDRVVTLSRDPPKDKGQLYFFQRVPET